MTLELSYYSGSDAQTRQCYGAHVGSDPRTLTGSSANSAAIPKNAAICRIRAGENCRYLKNTDGTNTGNMAVTSITGQYLAAGESIDVAVTPDKFITAMTV